MGYFPPREAQTTLKCPTCGTPMKICRSCQSVHMECEKCKVSRPLNEFIHKADDAMERFLENVYFDRI